LQDESRTAEIAKQSKLLWSRRVKDRKSETYERQPDGEGLLEMMKSRWK
jgi:hypothetical protein